jgi:hypothetical protein
MTALSLNFAALLFIPGAAVAAFLRIFDQNDAASLWQKASPMVIGCPDWPLLWLWSAHMCS